MAGVPRRYAAHGHRLLAAETTPEKARQISRHFLVGPCGCALATLLALAFPPGALGDFLALDVFYLWPRRRVAA